MLPTLVFGFWVFEFRIVPVRGEQLVKGSAAGIQGLGQGYPEGMVLERLEQLYRVEVYRVIRELYRLLPDHRTRVAKETYRRDRARLRLVRAYLCSGSMGVEILKALLNYLLRRQQVFAAPLTDDV